MSVFQPSLFEQSTHHQNSSWHSKKPPPDLALADNALELHYWKASNGSKFGEIFCLKILVGPYYQNNFLYCSQLLLRISHYFFLASQDIQKSSFLFFRKFPDFNYVIPLIKRIGIVLHLIPIDTVALNKSLNICPFF